MMARRISAKKPASITTWACQRLQHIPAMRTLTRFVAAVVTVTGVPVYSTIASSEAHADPVATTATVLKVVDGDTVDIVDDVRGRLRIRLLGIDTPETKKPGYTVGCWGPEASEFAKSTLLGQRVASSLIPARACTTATADLGLPGQGRRMGLLGRSGPRGCGPFLHLSRPSLGPGQRDRRCRAGGKGRGPRTVQATMFRRNDLSTRVIRRRAPPPNGFDVRGRAAQLARTTSGTRVSSR